MDSFHRVTLQELLPLGRLPDPGATVAYVLGLTNRPRLRSSTVRVLDTAPARSREIET